VTLKLIGLPTEVREFILEVGKRQDFETYLVSLKSEQENGDGGKYVYRFIIPVGQGGTLVSIAEAVAQLQDIEVEDAVLPADAEVVPDAPVSQLRVLAKKPAKTDHVRRAEWGNR